MGSDILPIKCATKWLPEAPIQVRNAVERELAL